LAKLLVYRKVRADLGGRLRFFISGSAPLSPELNDFLHAAGFTIFEGYGLTETSPVISACSPRAVRLGTVGRPIRGVEVKIAEDGKILTRGPHVMKGYYKMEVETRKVLHDGWFHTGDLGFLDQDGFLTITGRKKDVIKTAGGNMIVPEVIENRLKASTYIDTAAVIGDRRKFAVALLGTNALACPSIFTLIDDLLPNAQPISCGRQRRPPASSAWEQHVNARPRERANSRSPRMSPGRQSDA
jgi:long-chain acyl-CoA synthetase